MELEDITLLIIGLSIVTLAFIGLNNDLKTINPNIAFDDSFNETFSKMNEEAVRVNQSSSQLFSKGVNADFGFLPTVQSLFGVGTLLLDSIGTLEQMIQDMAIKIGVPNWAVVAFGTLLIVGIIWAMYRATLGRQRI